MAMKAFVSYKYKRQISHLQTQSSYNVTIVIYSLYNQTIYFIIYEFTINQNLE